MNRFCFATYADPLVDFNYLFILANSIRTWANELKNCKIIVAIDQSHLEFIKPEHSELLVKYEIELVPVEIDKKYQHIPYNQKTMAAGQIENFCMTYYERICWLDVDSVILNLSESCLDYNKILACRPVDLKLIGCPYGKGLDSFWKDIFDFTESSDKNLYEIETTVDQAKIYSYFNAGMLIVDPKYRLLSLWSDNFREIALNSKWEVYFAQNSLYKIFLHQAVLTASIISELSRDDIQILDYHVNYSLRNHENYPDYKKVKVLDDLISFRLDDYLQKHDFSEFEICAELKSWIYKHILMTRD